MKKYILLLLLGCGLAPVYSQNTDPAVVAAAGQSGQNNGIRLDWTLGELAVSTIQNNTQITQGFHQPYVTTTGLVPIILEQVSIQPNPSRDGWLVQLSFEEVKEVEIQLVDVLGQVLWSLQYETQIVNEWVKVDALPQGQYWLHFSVDNEPYSSAISIQKI